MLRKHVSSLEEKISTREKVSDGHRIQLQHLKMENENYEQECDELRKNVSLLEETLSTRGQTSDEHRMQLQHLKKEKEQYEHECNELRQSITLLEERLMQEKEESKRHHTDLLLLKSQYQKNTLDLVTQEATQLELSEHRVKISQLEAEKLRLSTQIAHYRESMEEFCSAQQKKSLDLSHAQQMIQVLKSKERYLESKVDSLTNQISKTVQDYEMRMTLSSSNDSSDCNSFPLKPRSGRA